MTFLNFYILFLLLPLSISFHYPDYLTGKKPMMKVFKEADLDKDMCAPVGDLHCGDIVAVIVEKGDYDFKCVKPCRFFANLPVNQEFKCPDRKYLINYLKSF